MNYPSKAIERSDIALSSAELADLSAVCQRTLSAHPEIADWLHPIQLSEQIRLPFLPIRVFRLLNVSRYSTQEFNEPCMQTFRSSGSTQSVRAAHHLGPTGWESYQRSVTEGFLTTAQRLGIPANTPIISLVPPRSVWPESSLAAMVSLWKESGLDIHYVPVESQAEALKDFFEQHSNNSRFASCIIFGTSLHYLSIAQWHLSRKQNTPFIHAQRLWIFDTGGTKGRTLTVSPAQLPLFFKQWVHPLADVSVLSEFGMCELSSQAYTDQPPHSNVFRCSPSLRALAVSEDLLTICKPGELGFLSYIDMANVDSWPFIITEDLGYNTDLSYQVFQLAGRAPDATVKGCSLNVKTHFRFDLSSPSGISEAKKTNANHPARYSPTHAGETLPRHLFSGEDLLRELTDDCWNQAFKQDLADSLRGWNDPHLESELLQHRRLHDQTVAIVASANIPVTWLFPAAHAWLMGAQRVDIYLPSVRDSDPLSDMIRRQITSLCDSFNICCASDFISVHHNRLPTDAKADRILIFGHDETIETVRSEFSRMGRHLPIIGLGHFRNKCVLQKTDSPEKIAKTCLTWIGRGCLTPLLLEIPDSLPTDTLAEFSERWLRTAADEFKKRTSHLENSQLNNHSRFAHRHNLAELRALAKAKANSFRLSIWDDSKSAVALVDLCNAEHGSLQKTGLDEKLLDWGGCGWLTLAHSSQLPPRWQLLSSENITPGLWQVHQGRTWSQWLLEDHQTTKE